ncbi:MULTISPECIES: restriction endonuclease [unclassified Mucilaginibacter]|uniref:restriction endonuclease n=1 Tax=unclassified Mucilaginibacter TaxID=2617802 RepID=UPI002AC91EF9|nr:MULTISPECIES: restriction endonuclease [unclassified Mucilaginibacter]MEB0280532.1 restriction endonuclease [Mucilaginibacter sp. 10B2]MEB0301128.1 restriction endonuclease [Mucilaginibacter sp. 5C4]WPX22436.1 restriction endonuclease [Mucilaginibacter sp. 5C4]
MAYQEEDIDFDRLDWKQFEELCYDLLVRFRFHSMAWRQGGADHGRDIEARRTVTDTITSPYIEKWFIECKRHSQGLSLDQVVEKINWARVEKADHFLLIVSSYLTTATRDWLDKARQTESFPIHIIEGKFLMQQLLLFPDIVIKYFADDHVRLVRSLLLQWVSHHILPGPKALYDLYCQLDFSRLNHEELAFMWHAYTRSEEILEQYYHDQDLKPIPSDMMVPFNFLIPHLQKVQNWEYPAMKASEAERFGMINGLGQAWLDPQGSDFAYAHIQYQLAGGERVQVLLVKENKILEVRIASGYKSESLL